MREYSESEWAVIKEYVETRKCVTDIRTTLKVSVRKSYNI